MRATLERVVDRLFPGMGLRPLYLSALATWAMVLYFHHSGEGTVPAWFLALTQSTFRIEDRVFHDHLWSHALAVVLLLVVPLGVCWLAEGWGPRELGFRVRGALPEVAIVLGLWLAMIPIVYVIHDRPTFAAIYPRLPAAEHDAQLFLLYEGLYLVKWIAWEFFFRGFMLFGLGRDFLSRSVLVSSIPFALMHYGKPEIEMASAFLAGLVLCFVALRGKSIWPGVLLHWLVAATLDFFASEWWR
ncbi:MAG: CPBP family intramembrane metalloprotease [Sandaracinaceae bacterium]|nr:CPBP family intramembrane metalloprotease [Sandaracinaceae bacterium]